MAGVVPVNHEGSVLVTRPAGSQSPAASQSAPGPVEPPEPMLDGDVAAPYEAGPSK